MYGTLIVCGVWIPTSVSYHRYVIGVKNNVKCLFVCFVALRPKSTAIFMAGQSFHLTTFFPGQA